MRRILPRSRTLRTDADLQRVEVAQTDDFATLQGIGNHILHCQEYRLHIRLVDGTRLLDAFGHLADAYITIGLHTAIKFRSFLLVARVDTACQMRNVERGRSWMLRCRPLMEELDGLGYNKYRHSFLKQEVAVIVKYLGEP